jgi:hypothetical protein
VPAACVPAEDPFGHHRAAAVGDTDEEDVHEPAVSPRRRVKLRPVLRRSSSIATGGESSAISSSLPSWPAGSRATLSQPASRSCAP